MLLLLPAINEMIDITTTRSMAIRTHVPEVVLLLLAVVSLAAAMLLGLGMSAGKTRSILHMVIFAIVITFAFYVILDLEFRAGRDPT